MKRRPNARISTNNSTSSSTIPNHGNHQTVLPLFYPSIRRKPLHKHKTVLQRSFIFGWRIVIAVVVVVLLFGSFTTMRKISFHPHLHHHSTHHLDPKPVIIPHILYPNHFVQQEQNNHFLWNLNNSNNWNNIQDKEYSYPDYGGLELKFLMEDNVPRTIFVDPLQQEYYWEPKEVDTNENDFDTYYAFDDDVQRNPYQQFDDDTIRTSKHCRRVAWYRKLPINCNIMHEFDFLQYTKDGLSEFTGEGSYRQVYWVEGEGRGVHHDLPVAYKKYKWNAAYDFRDYEFMRMDALVGELMTSESDIVDVYGFCALAMLNEGMIGGDLENIATPVYLERDSYVEKYDRRGVHPLNNLTAMEKLDYSLQMAVAISKLHAFPDGVIVHDDIHLGQFLLDDYGHLKLQDFNRAEIMLWNEEDEEYCRFRNNPGNGEFRAPEEYLDRPLNEKIDVWSLGMNMFYLLTGSMVLPEAKNTTDFQERIMRGQKPPIDQRYRQRSFAEQTIVDVIERCWIYNPDERISIFEVVEILTDAKNHIEQKVLVK